ncbi:MAG: hypothetical protein ABI325_11190 [Ginsengibacter sp.]
MANKNKITALIFGAAVGVALVKFFSMPKEDREAFYNYLKDQTSLLIDNAEDTVEKVEHYMDEFKEKNDDEWIEKLFVLKKMFKNLYGSENRYLL